MFGDKIGESSTTTGTGTFSLGGATGAWRAWSTVFSTGDTVFYYATNAAGSTWELGYGTFTDSSPDTISRNLLASSTGALISWTGTYYIYSAPVALVLKHLFAPLINGVANVPGWFAAGAMWLDYTLGLSTAWIKKRYISGTRTAAGSHAEEGRHYLGLAGGVANIFVSSPRHYWVDKGAANYTIVADDVGKVLEFDVTAANRVPTLPAISSVGHGFAVGLRGYGSSSNSLTLTPNGSDAIDAGAGGATKSLLGELPTVWVEVDGARTKWVTSVPTAASQADQEAASSTAAFVTPGRQQYHPSAAKAWLKCDAVGTISASYNITGIVDAGTGTVTVTLDTDFSSANYTVVPGVLSAASNIAPRLTAQSVGTFTMVAVDLAGNPVDPTAWFAACYGDQ